MAMSDAVWHSVCARALSGLLANCGSKRLYLSSPAAAEALCFSVPPSLS